MLIPLILERTHVTYLCTRVCVEYPTIYINIEAIQHILIVIHIYAFEKNIHSHAQGIASKLTLNYILNIWYYKLTTHIWNIYHTNFIASAYWKANYILQQRINTSTHALAKTQSRATSSLCPVSGAVFPFSLLLYMFTFI